MGQRIPYGGCDRGAMGFILLEILVSALIIAGAVASAMYLFRVGFQYLEKVRVQNELVSRVPRAVSYLSQSARLERGSGSQRLDEEVELKWQAVEIERVRPVHYVEGIAVNGTFEITLYAVNFTLTMPRYGHQKSYSLYVTRYRKLIPFLPDI